MPTTPHNERRDAIRLARSDTVIPSDGTVFQDDSDFIDNKIERYAELARLIDDGLEQYLADTDAHAALKSYPSVTELDSGLKIHLNRHIALAFRQGQGMNIIRALHPEPLMYKLNTASATQGDLKGGINTYVEAASNIYTILASAFGVEAAEQPGNSRVLDRLSKIHVAQITPYLITYLLPHPLANHRFNQKAFVDQLERDGKGFRFKKDFPEKAAMPFDMFDEYVPTDTVIVDGTQPYTLADMEHPTATIGCPVTFNPQNTLILWNHYVELRKHLRGRSTIARFTTDDTVALVR